MAPASLVVGRCAERFRALEVVGCCRGVFYVTAMSTWSTIEASKVST